MTTQPLTQEQWDEQRLRVKRAPHGFKHVEVKRLKEIVFAELDRSARVKREERVG